VSTGRRVGNGGPLSGRTAVVIGASSGIGAATARAFAEAGAHVHAAARREPSLGDDITGHQLDVVDRSSVDAFARALTDTGPIHVLVVAAGANRPDRSLDRLTPEGWDALISVNLTGAFNVVRAFLGALREARGDAILIGSVSGSWPDVSGSAYQAAKAGLLAFARGAAFEEHSRGVRFTTILPGVVDTPILDSRPEPPPAELRAHMLQPEDVAAACLFAATLPPRAHVPELTILPTALQSVGKTNLASPPLPGGNRGS
jgi:NAD(P)-dependent dehydrogenase (short-subunit alcohol dehydrogenase family)